MPPHEKDPKFETWDTEHYMVMSGLLNSMDKLWCDYCNKQRHTRATCWKQHGKPQNRKQRGNRGGFQPNRTGQANQTSTVNGNNGQGLEGFNPQDFEKL